MGELSEEQIARFERDGFLFPLPVFTAAEVAALRRAFERAEARIAARNEAVGPSQPPSTDSSESSSRRPAERHMATPTDLHLLQRWAWDAVTDPRVVEPVTSLIGPNVLLWSLNWFIKEPGGGTFVSLHQDANYWGLVPHDVVTAWIALTDASLPTGPMRFLPGSHRRELFDHENTYANDNLLSRGQRVRADLDESEAVLAPLAAGEMSLHHVRLVHGSGPNETDDRRIGMVLRFCATHVRQTKGGDTAVLVAGDDAFGHFELLPPPAEDFGVDESARHAQAVERLSTIILSD